MIAEKKLLCFGIEIEVNGSERRLGFAYHKKPDFDLVQAYVKRKHPGQTRILRIWELSENNLKNFLNFEKIPAKQIA